MMNKADFQHIVETAANKIPYKKAYYKLGHLIDLMHGHLIFTHKDGITEYREFADITRDIDWSGLSPMAVLFHSQEYPRLADNFFGQDVINQLNRLNNKKRNWIMWLKRTGLFRPKNLVQNARWHMSPGVTFNGAKTLYDKDINPKHFGKYPRLEGSWSFYFYKINCDDVPKHFIKDSNVIEINHKATKTKVCLSLDTLECDSLANPNSYCPGVLSKELKDLPPETTIDDLANY